MVYQDGDGTWEPFKQSSISTDITLYKNDVYTKHTNGTILRKRAHKSFSGLDDENWTLNPIWSNDPDYAYFYMRITDMKVTLHDFISNRFKCITDKIAQRPNEEAMFKDSISTNVIYISILKSRLSSQDAIGFKTWLKTHPVEFEYELASPKTEYTTIPPITSFDPHTVAWTDSEVETQIEWRPAASSTLTERFYAVEQYRKVLDENT